MSIQTRLSVLLRRSAEMTLQEMVHCIFSRFYNNIIKGGNNPNPKFDNEDFGESSLQSSSEQVINSETSSESSAQYNTSISGEKHEIITVTPSPTPSVPRRELDKEMEDFPYDGELKSDSADKIILDDGQEALGSEIKQVENSTTASTSTVTTTSFSVPPSPSQENKLSEDDLESEDKKMERFVNSQGVTFQRWNESEEKPCSSKVLIKLLSFFCGLINPNDSRKSVSIRVLGINILNTIIESQGPAIAEIPELLGFVCNDMCKYLLQALQKIKKEETIVMNLILRLLYNIFVSLGSQLKFQIEVFFIFALRILSDEQTPIDQSEIVLEVIIQLLREPSFSIDLYINYDSDLQSANLFSNLIEFFYKSSMKEEKQNDNGSSKPMSNIRLLALDALIAILQSVCKRKDSAKEPPPENLLPSSFVEKRQAKGLLMQIAEYFKEKPSHGLEYAQEKKILPVPLDSKSVAIFFRNNVFLDKTVVGEYLGANKEFNQLVLKDYVESFDFKGKSYLKCLREFIESFIPGGESQIIERYIEKFVNHYLESNNNVLVDKETVNHDAAFLLGYSIIMLNVDWHSPVLANRPKMSLSTYQKQLKGLNNNGDFPQQLLMDIYEQVVKDEIKVHREHLLKNELTDGTWVNLMSEVQRDGQTKFIQTQLSASHYDSLMFESMWSRVIAAAKFVFSCTKAQDILEKTLSVFQMCALISSHYKLSHALDNLIITLCDLSTITALPSETFIQTFSRAEKSHVATVALFAIARTHGDHIRESWRNLVTCLLKLHSLKLLPSLITFKDEFTFPEEHHEPVSVQEPSSSSFAGLAFGLVSATSSWILGSSSTDETAEEIAEKKLKETCKQIIKQCDIPKLLQYSTEIEAKSLDHFVKSLIAGCQSSNTPTNGVAGSGSASAPVTRPSSPGSANSKVVTGSMFCTDLLTQVTIQNKQRLNLIWPKVKDHFEHVCIRVTDFDLVYRSVTDLMVIAMNIISLDDVRVSVLQTLVRLTLREFNSTHHSQKLHRKIAVGISQVLISNITNIKTSQEWELIVDLIKWMLQSDSTLKDGFEVLYYIITTQPTKTNQKSVPSSSNSSSISSSSSISINNKTYISKDNFSFLLELTNIVVNMKQHQENVQLTLKCLEMLQYVVSIVPTLVDISSGEENDEKDALQFYWIPTLQYLCTVCRDSRLEIQNHAMAALQRSLLAPELFLLSSASWVLIFEKVMFPLLTELLRAPTSSEAHMRDMVEEMRLRAASILCKTFLQYLSKIIQYHDFNRIWIKILNFIEMYMNADSSELLAEAVTEALKNILMVMNASGILRPSISEPTPTPNNEEESEEDLVDRQRKNELWDYLGNRSNFRD
eukprot:TRINITY_DN1574_c0_g2_i2.p1 TRINITY_DN1574_c0_g2~~TRINITY_DN1574_c0_g2_i2.p1  ORF type:complete len:1525 (-),score=310.50 TRINITY_DN1574_c0_g2_i2:221-4261(-)